MFPSKSDSLTVPSKPPVRISNQSLLLNHRRYQGNRILTALAPTKEAGTPAGAQDPRPRAPSQPGRSRAAFEAGANGPGRNGTRGQKNELGELARYYPSCFFGTNALRRVV